MGQPALLALDPSPDAAGVLERRALPGDSQMAGVEPIGRRAQRVEIGEDHGPDAVGGHAGEVDGDGRLADAALE